MRFKFGKSKPTPPSAGLGLGPPPPYMVDSIAQANTLEKLKVKGPRSIAVVGGNATTHVYIQSAAPAPPAPQGWGSYIADRGTYVGVGVLAAMLVKGAYDDYTKKT